MNHLLIFCEGVLLELYFGRRKARRPQYATYERDELDDCMIVCLYSTWKKKKHLAMPAWNEALINAIYTAQGNVEKRTYANLLKYGTFGEC
jgi:hypothetical protein